MHPLVITGGTFDTLHAGHRALLRKALSSGRRVLIGLCTDSFASERKGYEVRSYEGRRRSLLKFLGRASSRVKIIPISDEYGPAASMREADAIIASTETEGKAREINRLRKAKGLKQLRIITVPLVYAEDLKKIACERVRAGRITSAGKALKPVLIAVGSENRVKTGGVRAMAKKFFRRAKVVGVKVDSQVPEQPFERETLEGAINRAIAAYRKAKADYGVGMESGLFRHYGRHFDVQWCAVYDGENITLGHSMGFEIPPGVVRSIRRHSWDMNRVFEKLTGIKGIGGRKGAIGYLSNGITERKYMSEQSFLCAMIPRLNSPAYRKRVIKQ